MSIYKKQLPIAIAALICSGQLGASLVQSQQVLDDRLNAIENELAAKRKVSPTVTQKNDFFFTGEYLLWHANESGLAYGVKVGTAATDIGTVQNIRFDWDSGFRVGVGYRIPHDKWEITANWTRFTTDASGHTSASSSVLFPEWATEISSGAPGAISSMSGKWNMRLNILDGEMGRYFMVTRWLALKPHFGIRGAWIKQTYKTNLDGGFAALPALTAVITDHLKIKNDFKGVGLRGGLDSEWTLYERLSIYGNAAYSLIYGNFSLNQHEQRQLAGAAVLSTVNNVHNSFQQIVSIGELAIGLRWDHTFCNEWVALRLQAGWEFNAYFGQNQFAHFGTGMASPLSFVANNDDLTIQGFVLSARLDF